PTRAERRSASSAGRRSRSISHTRRCTAPGPTACSRRSSRGAAPTSSSDGLQPGEEPAHVAREGEGPSPEPRPDEVGTPGRLAVETVGPFVALVLQGSRRRGGEGADRVARSRLDLRSLVPLVVARDRDPVGTGRDRSLPHRVVRLSVPARQCPGIAGGAERVVAGADRGGGPEADRTRLRAQAPEAPGRVP